MNRVHILCLYKTSNTILQCYIYFMLQSLMHAVEIILKAMRNNHHHIVNNILIWFTNFFDTDPYRQWIDERGGWVMDIFFCFTIVQFY